jgi:hypothetical protein
MAPVDEFLRGMMRGSDREAALRADDERRDAANAEETEKALAILKLFNSGKGGIFCGTTPGPNGQWMGVSLPTRIIHERSGHCEGATGTGKTTFQLYLGLQALTSPGRTNIFCDFQGADSGLANQLLNFVIPGLAMRLPSEEGAELLAGLRVIAPWQNKKLPSLHLTSSTGNINTRAAVLVDTFGATTNVAGAGDFGPRMLGLTLPMTKLLMKRDIPAPLFGAAFTCEPFRNALVAGCDDPELAAYFRDRFAADFRDAGAAVLSRLDRFFLDDATRLACFGPDPLDASDWIERGNTVLGLGGAPPLIRSFWAAFAQTTCLGAILSRRPTRTSPRVLLHIDEAQLALVSTVQARELDDALSRMRGRRAALLFANQHAGQLSEYSFLKESLKANCGFQINFRVPRDTFAASGCETPNGLLPGMSAGVTEAQVREVWMSVVANLPDRTFLLSAPGFATTIPVRAPDFDVRAFARGVPKDVVDLAKEGQGGYDRQELAEREAAWRKVVAEIGTAIDPNVDALQRFASAPRRGNGRRGPRGGSVTEVG